MKTLEKKLPLTHKLPRTLLSYMQGCRLSVFDIETTGLSHSSDKIILIGFVLVNEDSLLCKQFLAEDYSEELLILTEFANEAKDIDILFNYNGDRFDVPFVNKRSEYLGIDFRIRPEQSIDLLKIIRGSYFAQLLPDLKQKTVETFFCGDRKDIISGAESAILYKKYAKTKDTGLEQKILLHNFDDVRLLYDILKVFGKLDIHQIMFQNGFFVNLGESISNNQVKLYISKIKLENQFLHVTAHSNQLTKFVDDFYSDCHIIANPYCNELNLMVAVSREKNYTFIDLSAFELSENLSNLSACYSGYLAFSTGSLLNHHAVNLFIKELLCKIQAIYAILKNAD